jgi:hypothetical protein
VFRALYARGRNFVVSPQSGPGYGRVTGGMKLEFVSPGELRRILQSE